MTTRLISQDIVDQPVSGTNAETIVFTGSIPAGSAGKQIVVEQTSSYSNNNLASRSCVVRAYIGGGPGVGQKVSEWTMSPGKIAGVMGLAQRWAIALVSDTKACTIFRGGMGGPGSNAGNFSFIATPGGFCTSVLSGFDFTTPTPFVVTVQLVGTLTGHIFTSQGCWLGQIDRAAVAGEITLVIGKAIHAHLGDGLTVSSVQSLVVADARSTHTADVLTLGVAGGSDLVLADSHHSFPADSPALVQTHSLVLADAEHAQSADEPTLAQAHALVVADAGSTHATDGVVLVTGGINLLVADAVHVVGSDVPAFVQSHVLAVQDARSTHVGDTVALGALQTLVVADARSVQVAEVVALAGFIPIAEGEAHGFDDAQQFPRKREWVGTMRRRHR